MEEQKEEEQLDPRVQIELERLNASSEDINKLENKLEEANGLFRSTLSDSTANLKLLSRRLGATVEKARPFYEAREAARRTQIECQRAAVQFQRASVLHQNARETIQLAEQRFLPRRGQHVEFDFDNAWQEMLNHATMKLLEAERLKTSSEQEHFRRANNFANAQKKLKKLEHSLDRPIVRARPYFEQREVFQQELMRQKAALQQLQRSVTTTKARYSASLRELEHISEQIHEQRRLRDLESDLVPIDLDTCDLGSVSGVAESATSDYQEDFKLSQEQQYWTEMREQIEALSAVLPGSNTPSAGHPPGAAGDIESPPAEELSAAHLIAHRRTRSDASRLDRRRDGESRRHVLSGPDGGDVEQAVVRLESVQPDTAAAQCGSAAESAQSPSGAGAAPVQSGEPATEPGQGAVHDVVVVQPESRANWSETQAAQSDAVAQSEESVTQSEEPVVQCEESVVRSEEPVVKSEEPVVQSEEPVVQFEELVVQSEEPVVQFEEHVIQSEEPVVQSEEPVVQSEEPVVQSEEPVVQSEEPVVQSEEPVIRSEEPVVQSEEPVVQY